MIRALIFDCFGVIYQGSLAHLLQLVPESKKQSFQDLRIACDRGYISKSEYGDGLSEILHISRSEIEEILQEDHIRNVELVTYIKTLKKNYKIGLLTNVGSGVIEQLFSPSEQQELFDAIVKSSEVGSVKPYPEIYEAMIRQVGVPANECIMIDDLIENVRGAEAVGMKGIVFTSVERLKKDFQELGLQNA